MKWVYINEITAHCHHFRNLQGSRAHFTYTSEGKACSPWDRAARLSPAQHLDAQPSHRRPQPRCVLCMFGASPHTSYSSAGPGLWCRCRRILLTHNWRSLTSLTMSNIRWCAQPKWCKYRILHIRYRTIQRTLILSYVFLHIYSGAKVDGGELHI